MSTLTTERPVTEHAPDVDRDGLEVYCAEAQAWARTRDLFCETCGATDHDLR
ncbi:hypothetical protein [Georgenia sunbinii]|uniref:hypothetical protein n=1 Tax=Georgenia sunbinii TaxID=3117728 RepID=UPI002F269929